MENLKSDVVVIGAGPAGSSTSKTIAEKGFDVIMVEKDRFPGENNVCGGGISRSVVEKLGLQNAIEKRITHAKHYFPWGVRKFEINHVTVHRYVFDRMLADKVIDAGAKLLPNTTVKDVMVKNDRVLVALENGKTIESKIAVFADGPNTLAYRKFGLGFRPDADKVVVSVVCEVEWKDNPLSSYEFYYSREISPWGYGWVFPKKDTVNIGVGCIYSMLESNVINSLNYLLKEYPPVAKRFKNRKIVWLRSALIPAALADKIYGERILIAGDAAGMVDPISGGGIVHSITGGRLAGEVCVMALEENNFSSEFLSKYQSLWTKTKNYRIMRLRYMLSNLFLFYFNLNKEAYGKLNSYLLSYEGMRGMVKGK